MLTLRGERSRQVRLHIYSSLCSIKSPETREAIFAGPHLKALVPDHGPGAFVAELVRGGVGEAEGEGLGVDDGAEGVAAEAAVARPLRLLEGPCAADVLVQAVGRRVRPGQGEARGQHSSAELGSGHPLMIVVDMQIIAK